jgi:hypothetical protein
MFGVSLVLNILAFSSQDSSLYGGWLQAHFTVLVMETWYH